LRGCSEAGRSTEAYYRLGQVGLDRLSNGSAAERGKAIATGYRGSDLVAAVVKTKGIVKDVHD